MKTAELNRAVARATGENVDRIQRIGFGLLVMPTHPRVPAPRSRRPVIVPPISMSPAQPQPPRAA